MRLESAPRAAPLLRRAAPLARRPAPLVRRAATLVSRAAPLARRAAPLARRAAPLVLAGAAGTVLGRYVEARRSPQRALPPPSRPERAAPDVVVSATPVDEGPPGAPATPTDERPPGAPATPVDERPPGAPEAPEDLPDAEVVAEEEAGADALESEAGGSEEPPERPGTVDFAALARHPALSHEPPGDPPDVAVRAALAEVSSVHAEGVSVEVHDGVAYLRGRVDSTELIGAMHRRAVEVPEIRAVENLMHLPGTPPPLASERR